MWVKVGQQLRIVVPSGWSECFRFLGALNIRTGAGHYAIFDKACSGQFTSFLSDLLEAYPNSPIYIVSSIENYPQLLNTYLLSMGLLVH